LFTVEALRTALHLDEGFSIIEMDLLTILWTTTSPSETSRRVGRPCTPDIYLALLERMKGRPTLVLYVEGFVALIEGGSLGVLHSWVNRRSHGRQISRARKKWWASH
jgi:hypothetical protein